MKWARTTLAVLLSVLFALAPGHPVSAEQPSPTSHVLVEFEPGKAPGDADRRLQHWRRFSVPPGQALRAAIEEWRGRPGVVRVVPELEFQPFADPNDPLYPQQWNFPEIGLPAAWDSSDGAGVVASVVDSGLTRGDDLACRTIVSPYNAVTGATGLAAVADSVGHGTHVGGTLAQCTNNGIGVAGVAPSVGLMPVKVGNESFSNFDLAEGIAWAVDQGADVINLSLGIHCSPLREVGIPCGYGEDSIVDEAIALAVSEGVVLVAATGNNGSSEIAYPASHPDVIAVGATRRGGGIAGYSDRGPEIDLVAPGGTATVGILQQTIGGFCGSAAAFAYCESAGTSMAAPHVAGVAALIRSFHPYATRSEVGRLLVDTAIDLGPVGFDNTFGYGRVEASAALAANVVVRYAGRDRYATSATISQAEVASASTVFVATGEAFPDALAGAAAGGAFSGPMLLTRKDVLPGSVAAELARLKPAKIYVLGGTAVVSAGVVSALQKYAPSVSRVAGANRYATAAAISKLTFPSGSTSAVLVTGETFPDALSGGPLAATLEAPILLTQRDVLSGATAAELTRLGVSQVYIVGGTASISDAVADAVAEIGITVRRLSGANRYATSVAVSKVIAATGSDRVYLSTGLEFPDALGGGAAAAMANAPLLLIQEASVPSVVATEVGRLGPSVAIVLGGVAVVDASAEAALAGIVR